MEGAEHKHCEQKRIVALALAFLAMLLVAGSASADLPNRQEAETGPSQAAGAPHTDGAGTPTGASPNSYRFTANGGVRFFFTVGQGEQVNSVVVRAKLGGTSTTGANLVVAAKGTDLGTKTLTLPTDTKYAERSFAADLGPGNHTIDVFARDMQSGDKPIFDWVELRGTNGGGTTVACNDGADNDGDGRVDYPNDPGCSSATDTTEAGAATGSSGVLIGAGDIATSGQQNDTLTGNIIEAHPNATAFNLGDNVYQSGTPTEFNTIYDPAWGSFKGRTKPVVGNHEYGTPNASGYRGYFGFTSSEPLYYRYSVGGWQIYALDSQTQIGVGSPQYNWLQSQLQSNPDSCVMAMWHHPLASTGEYAPGNPKTQAVWNLLQQNGGDLVLSGHEHAYERWGKINSSSNADPNGMAQVIVGTGGVNMRAFTMNPPAALVKRQNTVHGVLRLNLQEGSYSAAFLPVAGKSYTDNFSGSC
jgi:Calcineurin-like phosphoesterase